MLQDCNLSLDLVGEELLPSVRLDALNGDRHLFDELVEEGQRRFRRTAGEESDDLIPRAVVDRSILIKLRSNLADVHLNPVTGKRAGIAPCAFPDQAGSRQPVQTMPIKDLVNRIDR